MQTMTSVSLFYLASFQCSIDDDNNLYGHLLVEEELKHALTALSERPVLLKCCLKEIVSARKTALGSYTHDYYRLTYQLVSRFFDALHGGRGRPIEMVAHDPVRYIGDILAWIHQSAASERELVDSLLSMYDILYYLHFNHYYSDDDDDDEVIDITKPCSNKKYVLSFHILNEIFETLNSHLKVRIDQILNGEEVDMIMYFRLGHLMQLYSYTIIKILGKNSSLPMFLLEYDVFNIIDINIYDIRLRTIITKKFFQVLQKELEMVTSAPLIVTDDLRPPEPLIDTLHKLVRHAN